MPRQPQVTLSVAHIGPGARRLEPPAELGEVEAAIFRQVVAAAPYEHFTAEDLGLLCAYIRALARDRRASDEQALSAVAIRRARGWPCMRTRCVRSRP